MQATRCWQLRVPQGTTHLIVDSAAALGHLDLREVTRDANSILIPVLPSPIDIHAVSRCIADLLLVAKIDRQDRQLAVIANRTRANTKSYEKLMTFNASLGILLVAVLRDTQNYVHAAEKGLGSYEMPPYKVKKDIAQMSGLVDWLGTWRERRREFADHTTAGHPCRRRASGGRLIICFRSLADLPPYRHRRRGASTYAIGLPRSGNCSGHWVLTGS